MASRYPKRIPLFESLISRASLMDDDVLAAEGLKFEFHSDLNFLSNSKELF